MKLQHRETYHVKVAARQKRAIGAAGGPFL
jgi:hypothetical protein